ncbi:MAG: outer membrane beta-barrel protein [Deltaproteobacteria bacterium]|nr:outer membrane beta-barrel protein [Deltaproteobacteria bacterium]
MTPRLMLLSIAPLFVAASANAQAPGEWTPEQSAAQPHHPVGYAPTSNYAQPPVAAVAPAPRARRWSIGLNVGQTELTANSEYDSQSATFDTGSLAIRYRPWRHLELELSFGGGSQTVDDDEYYGGESELAMATGTLAARYRFNPQRHWNWWLLAGIGGTTVANSDASDDEVEAAQRPHGVLGIGVEHRWTRFAVQFELRAMAVGQTKNEMELADQGIMTTDGLTGGNFAFGASYYF